MNVNEILVATDTARDLYYKLILLVGENNKKKNDLMIQLLTRYNVSIVNVNKDLSKILLGQTINQRKLHLSLSMGKIIPREDEIIILDHTEILFDKELEQNPLHLLESLSRNQTIVAFWNGQVIDGKLTYAKPGHPEYRSYGTNDLIVIEINKDKVEI